MKSIRTILVLAATTLVSPAAVMNITVGAGGVYLQDGIINPDNSLASVAFYESFVGSTSNSKASNLLLLQGVIANWNGSLLSPPVMPAATSSVSVPDDNDSIGGGGSYTTAAGYDYVVFHFGNGQAGAGGGPSNADENGWWAVWYLGGESKSFSAVPTEGAPDAQPVGGFSSARYFNGSPPTNRVPDGGTTIASLGAALLGLGGLRRLIKKD